MVVLILCGCSEGSVVSYHFLYVTEYCAPPRDLDDPKLSRTVVNKPSILGRRCLPPLSLDASLGRTAMAITPGAVSVIDNAQGLVSNQQQTSILQYMRTSSRFVTFFKAYYFLLLSKFFHFLDVSNVFLVVFIFICCYAC